MRKLFIVVSFFVIASSTAFAQKSVTINEECVYLDELTAPHIPHKAVVCGINPGDSKFFTKDAIQNYIARNGLSGKVINDVTVRRVGEKLSERKFISEVESAYAAVYPDTKIVIEQIRIPVSLYGESQEDFKVSVDTSKFGGNYAVVKSGKKQFQVYYFAKGFKDGYVTSDRVKAGDNLSGKLKKELVEITNLKSPLAINPDSKLALRAMPAGKAVTEDLVQEKPALKKGDAVKIVYDDGVLKIETRGVVEANAMPGQPVAVRNISSQKIISANYIGNGVVMANF